MPDIGHSLSRVVLRWAGAVMRYRRRRIGEQIMNDLPPSLQRDIGWEPTRPRRRP